MILEPKKAWTAAAIIACMAGGQIVGRYVMIGDWNSGYETRTIPMSRRDAVAAVSETLKRQGWTEYTTQIVGRDSDLGLFYATGASYLLRPENRMAVNVHDIEGKPDFVSVTVDADSRFQSAAMLRERFFTAMARSGR